MNTFHDAMHLSPPQIRPAHFFSGLCTHRESDLPGVGVLSEADTDPNVSQMLQPSSVFCLSAETVLPRPAVASAAEGQQQARNRCPHQDSTRDRCVYESFQAYSATLSTQLIFQRRQGPPVSTKARSPNCDRQNVERITSDFRTSFQKTSSFKPLTGPYRTEPYRIPPRWSPSLLDHPPLLMRVKRLKAPDLTHRASIKISL